MHTVTDIRTMVRGPIPPVPFESIAKAILGAHYQLSLVICGDALVRKVNRAHRSKKRAANVLSFPLTKDEGEIFLNIRAAEREAKEYRVSLRKRAALLFIHACLHLKGFKHGKEMERAERAALKKFDLSPR